MTQSKIVCHCSEDRCHHDTEAQQAELFPFDPRFSEEEKATNNYEVVEYLLPSEAEVIIYDDLIEIHQRWIAAFLDSKAIEILERC